ncbi:hypothetical protein BDF21DRAFT_418007 [Thamnidium elegans]|nr:hypothetical protein BDF21DRAFT_418007 [Thamnidium elegans]
MSYQNINYFNNNNGGYTEPIQFNQVFNNTCTIEDWFNPTTSNSTTDDFQQLLQLLPISPPLTASPTTVSDGENEMVSNEALVALFPDILNQQTTPKPVQIQRRPVAIMPKTAIPIAPRPGVFTPSINSIKRKIDSQKDSDEISQKRQKNTDAARRSRLKKIVKMETLEKQVNELEVDNSRLTTRVAVLESEKSALISKDIGLEDRIRVLEAQLAEAHRALTCKSSQ